MIKYKLLFNNVTDFVVYRLLSLAFPVLLMVIVTKNLALDEVGLFFLAQTIALWISIFVDFGMIRYGVVAYQSGEIKNIANVIYSQIFISIILFPLLIVISLTVSNLSFIDFFFSFFYGVINGIQPKWYFQAKNKMNILAKIEFCFKTILLLFIFSINIESRYQIELLLVLCYVFIFFTTMFYIRIQTEFIFVKFSLEKTLNLLKSSYNIFISRFFGNLSLNANILIVGSLLGPNHVAVYGIIERIVKLIVSLLTSISESLYPLVVKTNKSDIFRVSLISSLFASLIAYIFSCLFVPKLATYFFDLNEEYYKYIYIMSLSVFFYSLSSVFSLMKMVAKSRYKEELIAQVYIGLLSIIISFLMIKNYALSGAVTAYLVSSVISFMIIIYFSVIKNREK